MESQSLITQVQFCLPSDSPKVVIDAIMLLDNLWRSFFDSATVTTARKIFYWCVLGYPRVYFPYVISGRIGVTIRFSATI